MKIIKRLYPIRKGGVSWGGRGKRWRPRKDKCVVWSVVA